MDPMESSNIPFGSGEEDNCGESGWTAYLGSSMSSDEQDGICNNNKNKRIHDDQESDDSMASDASSGPIHHKLPPKSVQKSRGGTMDPYEQAASKHPSGEKQHKEVIKEQRKSKSEKQEAVLKAKSAGSHVQSRAKVRISQKK